MRPLIIIGAILLVLILGKVFFFKSEEPTGPMPAGGGKGGPTGGGKAMPVDILVAQVSEANQAIYSTGTIVPNEEVELRSEVNGRLVKLNFREGTFVQKGQLIAKLQDDDLKAQLKKLEYEEALAKQIEARQKKLLDINAISKEEYEIAANKVSTLSADKELLKVQLAKTEIKAPFSGRIGLKNISEGAYITPATSIGTLIQTNPIKIDFTVPEKYSSKIQVGRGINFLRDGSTSPIAAKVVAIDPKVDEALRTLKVRALTTNAGNTLLPGMFVKVNLNLGSERSIMVPTQAVVPVLAGKIVYVKKEGKVVETPIQTGLRTEKDVQVLEGIQVGDSIITSAIMSLKAGAAVKEKVKK